jgi:DNA-binding winged helix-turn-helix (wHTH) protein
MRPEPDPRQRLSFGAFELNEPEQTLLHAGRPVPIQPKPLAILFHLARNRERVVSKGELLRAIWPDVSVSDQALWSAVRDLRRALGDVGTFAPTIQTIRGRGFRFAAAVAPVRPPSSVGGGLVAASSGPQRSGTLAPFVDREDAMASLRASLAAAASGQMRVSFIAGPAGIGKTRLASELAAEAQSLGFASHTGRCFDREGAGALLALVAGPAREPGASAARPPRRSAGPTRRASSCSISSSVQSTARPST